MNQRARDLIYRAFVISHIFPTLLLALPLVLSPHAVPAWARKPVQFYLATYNDPLVGKKSYPGGWFGGMTLCEVALQLPYFLWTLTVPVGDKRLELPTLIYAVHAATAVLAALCELFAFPAAVLATKDLFTLASFYIPFQIITMLMAMDMFQRITLRLQGVKEE